MLSVTATLGLHPGGSGRCHPSAFQLPPRDVPALSSLRITAEAGAAKPSQSQQEPENNATSKRKHVRLLSSTTWRRCWIQQVPGPMAPSVSEQARAHLQGRQSRDPVRTVSTDTCFVHQCLASRETSLLKGERDDESKPGFKASRPETRSGQDSGP